MLKKLIKKIFLHFSSPLEALFYDYRKIYWLYSKFYLTKLMKVEFPKSSFLINIDYIDLLNLWKNITKRKPKVIVEIGSGYSTFLIIAAINKINKQTDEKIKFFSVEQNNDYLIDLKKLMTEQMINSVEFVITDLKIVNINDVPVSICTNFPQEKINFLYEDRADHPEYSIAGDAVKIENEMPNDFFICVDGMKDSVNFYKKNLKRKYNVVESKFCGTNFIPIQ